MNLPRKTRLRATALTPEEIEERASIRQTVFDRDRRCLLVGTVAGPCRGPATPHHLLKSGQGGPYTVQNLVTLCAWHNGWVERNRADSATWGLYVEPHLPPYTSTSYWKDIGGAWHRLILHGLTPCWWDGSPLLFERPDVTLEEPDGRPLP